jgi:hypothetical protein
MSELQDFIASTDRLIAFETKFKADEHSAASLKIFSSKVQDLWDDIDNDFKAFIKSAKDESKPYTSAESASVQDRYSTIFCTFSLFKGEIDTRLEELTSPNKFIPRPTEHDAAITVEVPLMANLEPSEQPDVPFPRRASYLPPFMGDNSAGSELQHSMPVPPCDMPTFRGDYESWPTFRDLFEAVFIRNSRLCNVERLLHLLHRTTGEAKEAIRQYPITNNGFDLAWHHLCSTYENERVLVNTQLKQLFSLPTITQESSAAIKKLQRGFNSCLDILRLHHIPVDNWDPILVFQCCQRLPETSIILWEQSLKSRTTIPSWAELDQFLSLRISTLDAIAETRFGTRSQNVTSGKSTKSLFSHPTMAQQPSNTTARSDKPIPNCPLCPREKHRLLGCKKFRSMKYQERWDCVNRLKVCSNCLSNSHTVQNCNSTFNCNTCQQRHHT